MTSFNRKIIDPLSEIPSIKNYFLNLQERLCNFVEQEDNNAKFQEDFWRHKEGGGGRTRVLTGDIIEKAGINFSHVFGKQLPRTATAIRPELANSSFQALGVSTVIHPYNPYVPTSHFNVRCIMVTSGDNKTLWWFGGGFDLTPYYGFTEDCVHWHKTAKAACDSFGHDVYVKYKNWADDYFFLKHRDEPRGVGGLFFDDLNEWEFEQCFAFIKSVSEHYIKACQPIISRRKCIPFGKRERDFQMYRRGRYVEFNLLYDRGTLFGLQSGGRTESILMSLPPCVTWHYDWQVEKDSPEAKLYKDFLLKREWL